MAKIGSLTADLKLESAAFIRDMRKAAQETAKSTSQMQKGMASLQKQAASLGTAMKGFLTIQGIRGLVNLGASAVRLADDIGDAATALGVGAEELQRLRYAAEQSDVSVESLDNALKLFQKSVASGKIKDASFEDFIQRIREAPTHIEKVRIAQQGLSKQFQSGILLASTSQEEFNRLLAEAPVITNKAVAGADSLSKEFLKINDAVTKGFATGFIEEFAKSTTTSAENIKTLGEAVEELGRILGRVFALAKDGVNLVIERWQAWHDLISSINDLIPKIPIPKWMGGPDKDSTKDLGIKPPGEALSDLGKETQEELEKTAAAAAELKKEMMTGWDATVIKNELTPAVKELHDTLESAGQMAASAFASAIVEGKDFQEVINDLLKDIAKMIIQMLLMKAIKSSIDAGFSAMTGVPTANFHGGGLVGTDSSRSRQLSPLAFLAAPRLHEGLKPSEFPAVLEKGEGVFTPKQMKALGQRSIISEKDKSLFSSSQIKALGGDSIFADMPRFHNGMMPNFSGSVSKAQTDAMSQRSSGDVNIRIDNRNGSDVQAKGEKDENGDINIEIVIDQVVGRKLLQPGAASNRAMKQGFGAQPVGIRR